jgi:hypothetical protein
MTRTEVINFSLTRLRTITLTQVKERESFGGHARFQVILELVLRFCFIYLRTHILIGYFRSCD